MKVLVTAKRVVDYNVSIRVLSDNSGVDLNNVKMSVSYTHLTLPTIYSV